MFFSSAPARFMDQCSRNKAMEVLGDRRVYPPPGAVWHAAAVDTWTSAAAAQQGPWPPMDPSHRQEHERDDAPAGALPTTTSALPLELVGRNKRMDARAVGENDPPEKAH